MNGIVKLLSPLFIVSFLFSHCELFSILARGLEKSTGQACANPSCCCDHDGPGGMEAGCGMCYVAPALFELLPSGQCCLSQTACDPISGLPVLSVNKDLQPVQSTVGTSNFANAVYFQPLEKSFQTLFFKPPVFHPPQA